MIDIVALIERTSPRHKHHCGEPIDITLACAQTFKDDTQTPSGERPLLLSMNLRKNQRSLMAYLPSTAYWAIPQMIESGRITHIQAMFAPLMRGHGKLLSVYLMPEAKIDEI